MLSASHAASDRTPSRAGTILKIPWSARPCSPRASCLLVFDERASEALWWFPISHGENSKATVWRGHVLRHVGARRPQEGSGATDTRLDVDEASA